MSVRLSVMSVWGVLLCCNCASAEVPNAVLDSAGDNREQIATALKDVPESQRAGLEYLVRNMPLRDLRSLSSEYLLENTRLAYESRNDDRWARAIPEDVFFDAVLPYATITERRDRWRADFRKRFLPLVKDAHTPSEVAVLLNQQIFQHLGVKYSTKRGKADQSPYESIESGLASCSGLSVLLIDACRSVGVPARFVGTPLWANNSGNHSWVEVWDNGWHFTGAAEPNGDKLDQGWFVDNASKANRDDLDYAIFATSFKQTPLHFPCVWSRQTKDISAVNVTDRYVLLRRPKKDGYVDSLFVVRMPDGQRVAAKITIVRTDDAAADATVFDGKSNDDRFDANDHLRVALKMNVQHMIRVAWGDRHANRVFTPAKDDDLTEFVLQRDNAKKPTTLDAAQGNAIDQLKVFLANPSEDRGTIDAQGFAQAGLSAEEVVAARRLLAGDRSEQLRQQRKAEMEARVIKLGDKAMPFFYKRFGDQPADGSSLYISLHGGGGAPARVNDRQWENQKRLYQLEEGIYLAPRAPTDTWDLWHQSHIDAMFARLIENMVIFENVNPNRVYVMGYSAGGDGVYQLAPRMSDRWAAAAMMAGHPNETSPVGLRNVPFALQMGGRDAAYNRNATARDWEAKLAELHKQDPRGYEHFVKIYPDKGHWMDGEDKVAIPWMAKFTRNATPQKIVWKQDDVTHSRFYWLGVDDENKAAGSEVTAEVDGQVITLQADQVTSITVFLDDRLIDLDQPVTIVSEGVELHKGPVRRTLATLAKTLDDRGDTDLSFPASVTVDLPVKFPSAFVAPETIPTYDAVRIDGPLEIDGRLDEADWISVQRTEAFVDLVSGATTQHDTRAAILWDDQYLYVGFWLAEPNVSAKYLNRDDPIYYDNDVELFVAGKDAYYEFEINAFGTIYEAFFIWQDAYDAGGYSEDSQLRPGVAKSQPFNGVGLKHHPRGRRLAFLGYDLPSIKSAVWIDGTLNDDSDTDQGWTVELALPWSSLKWIAQGDSRALPPQPNDQWRIDLFRFNKYKSPAPASDSGGWALGKHGVWDSHIPELFPIVTFVDNR